jgi:hypothetical protein
MRMRLLYAASPDLGALVLDAEKLIASPRFQKIKDEGKTLAGFIEAPPHAPIFLKRTTERSWVAGILDRFRGSRGARVLRGARILQQAEFSRPEPLAIAEKVEAGAIRAIYVASEALLGAHILSHFALGPDINTRYGYARRKMVSDALAAEVRRLHDAGIYTRDLQETNIMVEPRGETLRLWFLDVEDFRNAPRVDLRTRMLNLVHLDRSIGRFVSRSGRLDFLYAYSGRPREKAARRALVRDYLERRAEIDREHLT